MRLFGLPRRMGRWLARERSGPWFPARHVLGLPRKRVGEVRRAISLSRDGNPTATVARQLGVPRSTVRYWLGRFAGVAQSAEAIGLKPVQCGFESLHQHHPAYAYLLGMYLGDGYVCWRGRTYVLRVFLNRKQVDVVQRVSQALEELLPDHRVGRVHRRDSEVVEITSHFLGWPELLPQHGPGRKHRRPIVLQPWQDDILRSHPGEFLRGCIESDGCRHRRIVNGRNYPAYSFSNRSEDILRLFASACELLGLRYRRANRVTISIARRPDVARLDALMGLSARAERSVGVTPRGRTSGSGCR